MANVHAVTESKSGLGIRNWFRSTGWTGLANAGNSLVRRFTSHSLTPAEEAERDQLANMLVSPADSRMTYLDALTLIISKVHDGTVKHGEAKESTIVGRWISNGSAPCSGEDECRLVRNYNPGMMLRLYRLMGSESGTRHLADFGLKDAVMQKLQRPPASPMRFNTGDPELPMGGRRRTQRRQSRRNRQIRRNHQRRRTRN